jgi:hypothetical protein
MSIRSQPANANYISNFDGVFGRKKENFDNAEFYSSSDPEALEFTTPYDALCAEIEVELDGDTTWRKYIKENAPIKVYAYCTDPVPVERLRTEAEYMVENLEERLEEDYGNLDFKAYPLSEEAQKKLADDIFALLQKAGVKSYQCRGVGHRFYQEDELLEMFKDEIAEEEESNG